MAAVIYRGSTPTLRFRITNGMSVAALGDPTIAIVQAAAFLVYSGEEVTVDAGTNSISVKMGESDTLDLVAGVSTSAQCMFAASETEIVRFPLHEITVEETLVESLFEAEEEPEEEETEE